MSVPATDGLSLSGSWFRLGWLTSLLGGAAILRAFEPGQLPVWLPFHTSCGAITGLPCLFCGLTRAMHHLMNGDFSLALYYNWLAYPILASAVAISALFLAELIAGRSITVTRNALQVTPRSIAVGLAMLLSLWSFQVYLAISQHKTELLNPSGPLYAFFVK